MTEEFKADPRAEQLKMELQTIFESGKVTIAVADSLVQTIMTEVGK